MRPSEHPRWFRSRKRAALVQSRHRKAKRRRRRRIPPAGSSTREKWARISSRYPRLAAWIMQARAGQERAHAAYIKAYLLADGRHRPTAAMLDAPRRWAALRWSARARAMKVTP